MGKRGQRADPPQLWRQGGHSARDGDGGSGGGGGGTETGPAGWGGGGGERCVRGRVPTSQKKPPAAAPPRSPCRCTHTRANGPESSTGSRMTRDMPALPVWSRGEQKREQRKKLGVFSMRYFLSSLLRLGQCKAIEERARRAGTNVHSARPLRHYPSKLPSHDRHTDHLRSQGGGGRCVARGWMDGGWNGKGAGARAATTDVCGLCSAVGLAASRRRARRSQRACADRH
jgi:hypothetical protein